MKTMKMYLVVYLLSKSLVNEYLILIWFDSIVNNANRHNKTNDKIIINYLLNRYNELKSIHNA